MVDVPPKRSYRALYMAMGIMFVLLVAQLYNMQILQGSTYADLAKGNREKLITTSASRGIIYDRTGQRLVVNNPSYSIAVTPSNLPDVQCATGSLEGAAVFKTLSDTLKTGDVIAIKPVDLPPDKMVEVANRLSVPLQVNKNILLDSITQVMTSTPKSGNLFLIRRDVPVAAGDQLRAEAAQLPGIKIYNELEYNFITHFDNCLKPVVVQSNIPYDVAVKLETMQAQLPGVSVVSEPVRVYTNGPYFSHLLGYVGPISQDKYEQNQDVYAPDDTVGQTGLEASLESQLRGTKGISHVVVYSD